MALLYFRFISSRTGAILKSNSINKPLWTTCIQNKVTVQLYTSGTSHTLHTTLKTQHITSSNEFPKPLEPPMHPWNDNPNFGTSPTENEKRNIVLHLQGLSSVWKVTLLRPFSPWGWRHQASFISTQCHISEDFNLHHTYAQQSSVQMLCNRTH